MPINPQAFVSHSRRVFLRARKIAAEQTLVCERPRALPAFRAVTAPVPGGRPLVWDGKASPNRVQDAETVKVRRPPAAATERSALAPSPMNNARLGGDDAAVIARPRKLVDAPVGVADDEYGDNYDRVTWKDISMYERWTASGGSRLSRKVEGTFNVFKRKVDNSGSAPLATGNPDPDAVR